MFVNHIFRRASENPEKAAVVSNGQVISYRRFACALAAVRNHLASAGLPDAGVVARIAGNLYHEWVLLLAARSLGLTTVSCSSLQVLDGLGLKSIAGLLCLSGEEGIAAEFGSARPDCPVVVIPRHILDEPDGTAMPSMLPEGRFGDHILYTSGTTGVYKKLLFHGDLTEAAIIDRNRSVVSQYLSQDDHYFGCNFGPWSAAGYRNPLICWQRGATVVFDHRADWIEHFHDFPISKAFFVPGQTPVLKRLLSDRPDNFPELKVQIGGGFVNYDTVSDILDTPGLELFNVYGATEFSNATMNVVKARDDVIWLDPTFEPRFEIVDDEDRLVPEGVEGNMRVAVSPAGPFEYLDDPEATAKHFRSGWFYPGDMAVQREDGRVRVLGRVQDVLNLGGRKVAIGPIEEAARNVLGVENLCIFDYQDDHGSDVLAVAIEGDAFPERTRLEALARDVLKTARVRFISIDRFPRGGNGMMKIDRKWVLEQVRAL